MPHGLAELAHETAGNASGLCLRDGRVVEVNPVGKLEGVVENGVDIFVV